MSRASARRTPARAVTAGGAHLDQSAFALGHLLHDDA